MAIPFPQFDTRPKGFAADADGLAGEINDLDFFQEPPPADPQIISVPCGTLEIGPKVASLPLLLNRQTVGYPPTVVITPVSSDTVINVPLGTLTLTGQPPTVVANRTVAVPAGALTLTGFAPTVRVNVAVAVPAGALTLTGLAPTVVTNRTVSVHAGTLTLTGLAPTVVTTANVVVSPAAGALTLTGYAPTVVGAVAANVIPGGWYGARTPEQAARERKRRRDEDDEQEQRATPPSGAAQAGPGPSDATPGAPAADLELVRSLVAFWTGEADRSLLNRRAQRALDYALRAESVLAMRLFERELARQMEEEEMALLLTLLADD